MRHTIATSPLNCIWIRKSTVGTVEGIEYGVCRRLHDAERIVSEMECEFCPWWEPPFSGADATAGISFDAPTARRVARDLATAYCPVPRDN